MTSHIYIYGPITAEQQLFGGGPTASAHSVRLALAESRQADNIIVHINSPGGDVREGFAIHDLLVGCGKPVTTVVEGRCASIATVVLLAGTVREMTPNSEFMIHNPWGTVQGDAVQIRRYADLLAQTEQEVLQFYRQKTGLPARRLQQLMQQESFLNARQALKLGFITALAEPVQALAIFQPKTTIPMQQLKSQWEQLRAELNGLFGGLDPQMRTFALAEGGTLETDSDAPLAKGQTVVNINGDKPEAGTYALGDGRVLMLDEQGVITNIEEGTPDEGAGQLMALQRENSELRASLQEAMNTLEQLRSMQAARSQYRPPVRQNRFDRNHSGGQVSGNIFQQAQERRKHYKTQKQQ